MLSRFALDFALGWEGSFEPAYSSHIGVGGTKEVGKIRSEGCVCASFRFC